MATYRFPGEHVYEGLVLERCHSVNSVDRSRRLEPVAGDVMIASYPKTGSTWLQEVAYLVLAEGRLEGAESRYLYERVPFLETQHVDKAGVDLLADMARPALMKTHLPARLLQPQITASPLKVLLTIRNPKDTLVSLYHFYRMSEGLGNFSGSWDDFFELFKTKHVLYGDYFAWYASWLPYVRLPNVMLVTYEDMKDDMAAVIHKLADFLEKSLTDDQVQTIIAHTSFDSMKANKMTNYTSISSMRQDVSAFIRKGKVGDWTNYFSEEQSRYVEREVQTHFADLGVTFTY